MNLELYNLELDRALEARVPRPDDSDVAKAYLRTADLSYLKLGLRLTESRVLKLAGDHSTLMSLRAGIVMAIQVLDIVCGLRGHDFDEAIQEMREISTSKNNDYSPYNIWKMGNIGLASRMGDKTSRIVNALVNDTTLKVKDEMVRDTAMDLVNYSVYAVMIAVDGWVTDADIHAWQVYLKEGGCQALQAVYKRHGDYPVTMAPKVAPGVREVMTRAIEHFVTMDDGAGDQVDVEPWVDVWSAKVRDAVLDSLHELDAASVTSYKVWRTESGHWGASPGGQITPADGPMTYLTPARSADEAVGHIRKLVGL